MAYSPNTADIVNLILQGSTNVESIIRANSLNQLATATGNYAMGSNVLTGLAAGASTGQSVNYDQLTGAAGDMMPYVVSGCVWTADSSGASLNCSMTAGTIIIGGLSYSVSAVTSRAFAASNDTYVDVAISAGSATITYTAVANYTTSPALASSGTVLNTIRLAVISAAGSSVSTAGISQGGFTNTTNAGTQGSTTVAAGSNGSNITATPLNVAAITNFPTGGGWAQVAHSAGQTYMIQFTGATGTTLTGVTVIQGSGTVSTGDTVKAIWPMSVTDMLGNRIYPTTGYPGIIGGNYYTGTITTTLTANSPVAGSPLVGFVAPFIIPAGAGRLIRLTLATPAFGSSATAGTALSARAYVGNAAQLVAFANPNVKVASDFDALQVGNPAAPSFLQAPGSYTAQVWTTQGAAGTLTMGALATATVLTVELV